jgi:hypothetical protein
LTPGDRLPVFPFGPGAIVAGIQRAEYLLGEQHAARLAGEHLMKISEQHRPRGLAVLGTIAREGQGGVARALRPVAPGHIGDRKQRPPTVGGAVMQLSRDIGIATGSSGRRRRMASLTARSSMVLGNLPIAAGAIAPKTGIRIPYNRRASRLCAVLWQSPDNARH